MGSRCASPAFFVTGDRQQRFSILKHIAVATRPEVPQEAERHGCVDRYWHRPSWVAPIGLCDCLLLPISTANSFGFTIDVLWTGGPSGPFILMSMVWNSQAGVVKMTTQFEVRQVAEEVKAKSEP